MDLRDAVVLVTGAGVGSGLAIAERLADAGALLTLTDRTETPGTAALVARGRAVFAPADLADAGGIGELVDVAVRRFGRLSALVNNAGGGGNAPPHYPEATSAQWGATLDLNLRAPLLLAQHALPHLRAAGGAVVNIASTAGIGAAPYASPEYAAAKAGLIRATTSMAELDGVRMTCVVPDWLATDRALAELPDLPAGTAPPIPLSRLCDEVLALLVDDTTAGRVVVLDRPR